MKLIILEDHPGIRKKICALLDRANVEIRECSTGEEAILAARDFRPDWVIMDVNLNGMNGFEATRAICRDVPFTRVVVISTEGPQDRNYLHEAAVESGAEQFLSKHRLAQLPGILYGSPQPPAA